MSTNPRVVQRVSGTTNRAEVEEGIRTAFLLIDQLLAKHPSFDLLLDLQDMLFTDLQAHKLWHQTFLDHPTMRQHTSRTAIIGRDTPAFGAEKHLLTTPTCQFFLDGQSGKVWLDTIASDNKYVNQVNNN